MLTLQVIACIGIITGAFLLFHIRLNDFTGNIFHRLLDAPKGIREEILEETKRRKKSYFRREIEEVQAILKTTDREELFPLLCTASLLLFAAGAAIAVMIGNVFLIPVLGSHAWQLLFSAGVGGRIYVPALLVYQADRIPFQKGCVIGTGNRTVHYYNGIPAK